MLTIKSFFCLTFLIVQQINGISSKKEKDVAITSLSTSDYAEQTLNEHNRYRKKHCVPLLTLNKKITASAQNYSDYLALTDTFEHSDGSHGYGENLFWYSSSKKITNFKKVNATGSWYDEIVDYDFQHPDFSSSTGHFTQVVWKDTEQLGVGISLTNDGKSVYVVAQYFPPGNILGDFETNVQQAKC